ncbi:hypothetical protein D3C76_1050310 [compost metagenome]
MGGWLEERAAGLECAQDVVIRCDNHSQEITMTVTQPNQELRHDLKQAADLLKWSSLDLYKAVKRMVEAGNEAEAEELMRIAQALQETEDKLTEYADEVRVGRIVRGKAE